MNEEKSLIDYCHVDKNDDGDRFVGLKSIDNNGHQVVMVYFPCGYNLPSDEVGIRNDIINLFRILADFSKGEDILLKVKSNVANVSVNFPIKAYLDIIQYYLEYKTFYAETETTFKTDTRGKTDWSKTIKNQIPSIQNGNLVYINKTVRDSQPMKNQLITEIHRYCTHESFSKLGWLFGTSMIPRNTDIVPKNNDDKSFIQKFISIINDQLKKTFEDRIKKLLTAMLNVLNYKNTEDNSNRYYFGTDRFEYVWQGMIDRLFGIRENKQDYFPRTKWVPRFLKDKNKNKHPLEPDSIMIYKDKFYVLDAKYYRYGLSGDVDHLPNASDINKQITYGEYIYSYKNKDPYNAFIMPFNRKNNPFSISEDMCNVAEASTNWKTDGHKFEKIQGILVDTRFLMYQYASNNNDKYKEKLSIAIESAKD